MARENEVGDHPLTKQVADPSRPELHRDGAQRSVVFLREAARCFRNRAIATGEDSEFWASTSNAENCERIAGEYADMLAALQEAADWIKDMDGGDMETETGWSHADSLDVWLRIRAAISKATGQLDTSKAIKT